MMIIIIFIIIICFYCYYDYDSDYDRCCALLHVCYMKTPCVLWWCHSHPAILTAANLFNDFYPRSRRPIFVGNSDGHGRWIQTFDATEFATRMEELIFFSSLSTWRSLRPTAFAMNYERVELLQVGSCKFSWNFLWSFVFFGGACAAIPCCTPRAPLKMIHMMPKEKQSSKKLVRDFVLSGHHFPPFSTFPSRIFHDYGRVRVGLWSCLIHPFKVEEKVERTSRRWSLWHLPTKSQEETLESSVAW